MKQHGFILLTTIMLLSLLSLLVLSEMHTIVLYYKGLNQLTEKRNNFYKMEFLVQQLATKSWQSEDKCVIHERNFNHIISLLKTQGCSLQYEGEIYSYLVEELGVFPCVQAVRAQQHFSTKHWRINMLEKGSRQDFLQLRIVRPIVVQPCNQEKINYVPLGITSWRYLENIS